VQVPSAIESVEHRDQLHLVVVRRLRSAEQGRTNSCGHLDGHETVGREEVVLAALVDYPELAMAFRVFIRDGHVDLVLLKGRRVPRIANADDEPAVPSQSTA